MRRDYDEAFRKEAAEAYYARQLAAPRMLGDSAERQKGSASSLTASAQVPKRLRPAVYILSACTRQSSWWLLAMLYSEEQPGGATTSD